VKRNNATGWMERQYESPIS